MADVNAVEGLQAVAAFVGAYLGQRAAQGKLGMELAALSGRVAVLERGARRAAAVVLGLGRRVRRLERP